MTCLCGAGFYVRNADLSSVYGVLVVHAAVQLPHEGLSSVYGVLVAGKVAVAVTGVEVGLRVWVGVTMLTGMMST